jgi:membrane protein DedA with SNARE-associated domain
MLTLVAIAAATFVSEDATCIATGLLIQRGELDLTSGILACTTGIFVGDVGLWLLGRAFGRAVLAWRWIATRLPRERAERARAWLQRHAAGAIIGSRFTPGTRFALYVVAGVLRLPLAIFAVWALVGALLWTPTIILLTAALGDGFVARIAPIVGAGWPARIAAGATALLAIRVAHAVSDRSKRIRVAARIARWRRWEFWPMWLFYAPVAAWIAVLALWHRGLSTITAANPGIPDGGTVGESKFEILRQLPPDCAIPSVLIPPGGRAVRLEVIRRHFEACTWRFPLVLKPDVGQRGIGVRRARDWDDVAVYLARVPSAVLAQPYNKGPYEAGVFYYRMPNEARGRIFSITDKCFPVLVGDGASTIEELIWTHPRFRMQGDTFVARHRDRLAHVLATGERFPLAVAGNHAQGTLFRDGAHLVTAALEHRIDEIARSYPGFFVGRFDIRYRDEDAFKAGLDLAIVELNGATGESTNIYDPDGSLWRAYRLLFRQWAIVFAIGAVNRRNGARVSSARRLARLATRHLTTPAPIPVSD